MPMKNNQYSAKQKKLARLAEPRDRITQADVIAGRKMKIKKKKRG